MAQAIAFSNGHKSLKRPETLKVENALKGPVIDTFRQIVPELGKLSGDRAYEQVLNTPNLLDACFQLFRARTDLFASSMVDAEQHPVFEADRLLACGYSLNQIISMIVRSCARRHFRSVLDPKASLAAPSHRRKGWLARLWSSLAPRKQLPAKQRRTTGATRQSDRLYKALRDFLVYEWQVRLIPYYAPVPVAIISQLGARILEYRDPESLQALARGHFRQESAKPEPAAPSVPECQPPPPVPTIDPQLAAMATPNELLGADGVSGLDPERSWRLWNSMDSAALWPDLPELMQRQIVMVATTVNREFLSDLFFVTGLDGRQVLVVLFALARTLGPERFSSLYATEGRHGPGVTFSAKLGAARVAEKTQLADFLAVAQPMVDAVLADKTMR